LCLQEEDNVDHILAQCVYAREVSHGCCDKLQISITLPSDFDTFTDWWLTQRTNFLGRIRGGFESVVIGTACLLWKHMNARVFNRTQQQKMVQELVHLVLDEIKEWRAASFGVGG
jgi:hypothetical protein